MTTPANPPLSPHRDPQAAGSERMPSPTTAQAVPGNPPLTRTEVVGRQKERFGGMQFGAAFFGWLAACGTAVLLTALLAAAGTAIGLGANLTVPSDPTAGSVQTVGLVGAIVLLVITLIGYAAGGYVAGRMARFNGAKQGVGVWLWAVIAAVVIAVLTLIAGAQFNLLGTLNGFPRIPIQEGTLTNVSLMTAVAVPVIALVGAVLGGIAGVRYHRKVDAVGLNQ